MPEEGIGANFVVLFIPSSSSELANFVNEQVKALKEGITKEEYLSILEGYYARILKQDPKGEKSFAQKYFESVQLVKSDLLFEKDQKLLQEVIDKIKALTSR